jgi:hypothetical protein
MNNEYLILITAEETKNSAKNLNVETTGFC